MSSPVVTPQPVSTQKTSYSNSNDSSSVYSDEWATAVSKSCLRMSVMEPCVTKAAAHLKELKGLVKLHQLSSSQLKKSVRTPPPDRKLTRLRSGEFVVMMGPSPKLKVEGVSTGNARTEMTPLAVGAKSTGHGLNRLITELMGLLARLESDRQQALMATTKETEKAKQLKEALDKEKVKRLQVLPELVQAEHEQCLQDLRHLKWHATIEWKKLKKHQENERLLAKLNAKLKDEVNQHLESGPQIVIKSKYEKINIRALALQQEETSNRLLSSKKMVKEMEAELSNLNIMARAECKEMEGIEKNSTQKQASVMDNLRITQEEHAAITRSMREKKRRIDTTQTKIRDLGVQIDSRNLRYSQIVPRVDQLSKECGEMKESRGKLRETTQELADNLAIKKTFLEEEFLSQLSDEEQAHKKLRQTRRDIEEIEQSIETIKETIAKIRKMTLNDEMSVERAQDELVLLASQVAISVAEFTKVEGEYKALVENISQEKQTHEEEEFFFTDKIRFLKQAIRDKKDIQIVYERKISAHKEEIQLKRMKHGKVFREARASLAISEVQTNDQGEKVIKLQDVHDGIAEEVESLECKLAAVSEETRSVDRELEEKKDALSSQGRQLRVEVQEKVNRTEMVTEKIKSLESKVEEVTKSANAIVKLEESTNSTFDQLGSQLTDMEEKLVVELQKERSLTSEHKEISDFSTDAVARHSQYLKKREVALKQCKHDLQDSLSRNSELSADYVKLQQDFLDTKTRVLVVVQRKLELESNLRDYKQLLELMSQIILALKEYYQSREMNSQWKLSHFSNLCNQNTKELQMLKEQFQIITSLMQTVLDKIMKDKKQRDSML